MKTTTKRQRNAQRNSKGKKRPTHFRRRFEPDLLDAERAVFVTGEINDEMVAKLTPQIIALKRASANPINVFIDSHGGSVRDAQVILGLLKTPDQMGRCCSINTVATGFAHSAAADLLAEGDYVAAYQHACIHFHGTLLGDLTLNAAVARETEKELLSADKFSSIKLAAAVFPRQLSNYGALLNEIQQWRKAPPAGLDSFDVLVGDGTVDVPAFAFALADNLQTPYREIVLDCFGETITRASILKKFREVSDLERQLPPMLRSAIKQNNLDADATKKLSEQVFLLNALIADRITNEPDWDLSSGDFSLLEQAFVRLREVTEGTFEDELLERVAEWKHLFMSSRDLRFWNKHSLRDLDNPRIAAEWDRIIDRVSAKLESLWSFTLTLCGRLNVGENSVTPNDAYWLGLIDEVVGTPLARREIPKSVRALLLTQMPVAESKRFY